MRLACLVAIVALLAGTGTLTTHRAVQTGAPTPAALIDLHSIFGGGDENEPDENEADEGAPAQQPHQTRSHADHGGLPTLLLGAGLAVLAVAAGLFIGNRVRRLRARMRAWSAARR